MFKKYFVISCAMFLLLLSSPSRASEIQRMVFPLDDAVAVKQWQGLERAVGVGILGGDCFQMTLPAQGTYTHPQGKIGWHKHGFRVENDSTLDLLAYEAIRFDLKLSDDHPVNISVTLMGPADARDGSQRTTEANITLSGHGWKQVMLPWGNFDFAQAAPGFLRFIQSIKITAKQADSASKSMVLIDRIRLVRSQSIALWSDVRGKAADANCSVTYEIVVGNCTDQTQPINLSLQHHGWESMTASVEPSSLTLRAGETAKVKLNVKVSDRVAPGGHEIQTLNAIANGDGVAARQIELITTRRLPHPYILHTPARWKEVQEKVNQHPWARDSLEKYWKQADAWKVPDVARAPNNDPDDTMGPFLFRTAVENDLLASCYCWQITRNKSHAMKIADFLLKLSNPVDGYPVTLRGCSQGLVQEGHFFQHIAMAYDMILDADVLSKNDREQIENTFRIFMQTIQFQTEHGSINNWNLSEVCGAFYCALAMQDLAAAEYFFSGPSCIKDQLAKGTMDDGWWYECSISYNVWCASEFTQAALAYEPFGVNFKDMCVPANFSPNVLINSELSGGHGVQSDDPAMKGKPFGMDPSIFGPNLRPFRRITDLWNSLLPFIDYRGVMFGVNDSTENRIAGDQKLEIAYYVYRDPKYAAILKLADKRDLIYGVAELPEKTPELFRDNASADNVGLAMLRSQTPQRPIREQIQAALHYGTHGWAHGHFDRTDLLHLSRYGRSFFNPEMIWYSYEPFMYKFYVQTSIAHNMVVVDQKMQEATPGKKTLFFTGNFMQATAAETTARWSNPPYGGMVYDYVPVKTFAEKTWREGRFVPIPDHAPAYGTLTDFSEPVRQRRLMIVMDDYIVLADDLQAQREHTFDCLFQMKGFQGLESQDKKFVRHDPQWNSDPVGSAQFVTDCNWYEVTSPAKSTFEMRFGPGADNEGTRTLFNEDGVLKLDVHSLWPPKQEVMIATAPEDHGVQKQLFYTVRGDGKTLAENQFGAWILGKADLNLPVIGVKKMELQTKINKGNKPTIFWANARILTRDGKEISIQNLPMTMTNVLAPPSPGKDFRGGPIKIVGDEYSQAISGQPMDDKQPAIVTVDLSGIDAVSFKATLGGDYPLGDEKQRRKTYAIRSRGSSARFLTIIEPYENKHTILHATALSADKLRVELLDGRVQEIEISHFTGESDSPTVNATETRDGKLLRSESTQK